MPPNATKIYYRWGLEERLRQVSVKATGNLFAACESAHRTCRIALISIHDTGADVEDDTGGFYGGHDWQDEVISETGGDFLCMHVSIRSVPSAFLSFTCATT